MFVRHKAQSPDGCRILRATHINFSFKSCLVFREVTQHLSSRKKTSTRKRRNTPRALFLSLSLRDRQADVIEFVSSCSSLSQTSSSSLKRPSTSNTNWLGFEAQSLPFSSSSSSAHLCRWTLSIAFNLLLLCFRFDLKCSWMGDGTTQLSQFRWSWVETGVRVVDTGRERERERGDRKMATSEETSASRYVKLGKEQDVPVEEIRPGELNQPVLVPQVGCCCRWAVGVCFWISGSCFWFGDHLLLSFLLISLMCAACNIFFFFFLFCFSLSKSMCTLVCKSHSVSSSDDDDVYGSYSSWSGSLFFFSQLDLSNPCLILILMRMEFKTWLQTQAWQWGRRKDLVAVDERHSWKNWYWRRSWKDQYSFVQQIMIGVAVNGRHSWKNWHSIVQQIEIRSQCFGSKIGFLLNNHTFHEVQMFAQMLAVHFQATQIHVFEL